MIGEDFDYSRSAWPPDEIHIKLTYKCSVKGCGCVKDICFEGLRLPLDIQHPGFGWFILAGAWVCPLHKIGIVIDGVTETIR